MARKTSGGWAGLNGASLQIGSKILTLPGLSLSREVGRGMNAVVFEAMDDDLMRPVAVKVWNTRGTSRAQLEIAKMAQISHPLVVTVHRFGVVDGHPFAVMELVGGVSGKEWITQQRTIAARCHLWKLYSEALRHIYSKGQVHGDPHLGNMIIFPDTDGLFGQIVGLRGGEFALKLADMGTSAFWEVRGAFEERERAILIETMKRLFPDRSLGLLANIPPGISPMACLRVLDDVAAYVDYMSSPGWWDHRSQQADQIVELVMAAPLHDLDQVFEEVRVSSLTDTQRFARRLNAKLLGFTDIMRAPSALTPETRRLYREESDRFTRTLQAGG